MSKPTGAPWPDPEWIERIKAHDGDAWSAVQTACNIKCRRFFREWSAEQQYDLAMQAADHIISRILNGYEVRSMYGFISVTANNFYKSSLRRDDPHQHTVLLDHITTHTTQFHLDQPNSPAYRQLVTVLHTCLDQLKSEDDRQLIELWLKNYTYTEIGNAFDPPKTSTAIGVQLHRIMKKKLFSCLEQQGYTEEQVRRIIAGVEGAEK
ncbi:hypothetical protein [Candidatus Oscillochloris fontis]|uniref:hypothetical protein n=1 Tax=Candidatus Oscillochloris fontis TaxID=2496868 RepID=UPI00101BF1E8|nr:hypothetical protein [Candidatus Oscillochloris fontis]